MAGPVGARVLVLYTGGTIGMVPRDPLDPASPLIPADKARLAGLVANPLGSISWEIRGLADESGRELPPLDSASIGPAQWLLLARAIAVAYGAYDGFVVLHGTDTMAYSASALAFLLENLGKPVVFTGAQHASHVKGSDGPANLSHALAIAGWRASGLPLVPEVMLCFGSVVLRGCRATKVSTVDTDAFASPNFPPLARMGRKGPVFDPALIRPPPAGPFSVRLGLDARVGVAFLHPGLEGGRLAAQLAEPATRAWVLRSFGAGNAQSGSAFLDAIAAAGRAGALVVNTSQCQEGGVAMGRYEASLGLLGAGVLSGLDLTCEAALAKLMWLLPQGEGDRLRDGMLANLRGEQSGSMVELRFGAIAGPDQPLAEVLLAQRLAAPMEIAAATLALGGVGASGLAQGDELALEIRLAGQTVASLCGISNGPRHTVLLRGLTQELAPLVARGGKIELTLRAASGHPFWAEWATLLLFQR